MGWLGWSPDMALNTPVALIKMALDGKIDFLVRTTPGAQQTEPEKQTPTQIATLLRGLGRRNEKENDD